MNEVNGMLIDSGNFRGLIKLIYGRKNTFVENVNIFFKNYQKIAGQMDH